MLQTQFAGPLNHGGPMAIPGYNFNLFVRVTIFKMIRLTTVLKQIRFGTSPYNTN